jgi:hypothetical protein
MPVSNAIRLSGISYIPLRRIAFDTGIDKEMVLKLLTRFERDGKMIYVEGWLIIVNFVKHQSQNPSVAKGVERVMADLPEEITVAYESVIDSLSTACAEPASNLTILNLTKPNYTKPNLTKLNAVATPSPRETNQDFFKKGNTYGQLMGYFEEKGASKKKISPEFEKFIMYWTEPNPTGKKQRWQMERTFDVKRRLITWLNNTIQFTKKKRSTKSINLNEI